MKAQHAVPSVPSSASEPTGESSSELFILSAPTAAALRADARRLAGWLLEHRLPLRELCLASALRDARHPHRLAVVCRSVEELVQRLGDQGRGLEQPGVVLGQTSPRRGKRAFIFPGTGSEWWGMGRQLLATEPVFRDTLLECEARFSRFEGGSLLRALNAPSESESGIFDVERVLALNITLQLALLALWRSWGITPDAVLGHCIGNITAAYAAGVIDLEGVGRVLASYCRESKRFASDGRMAAAELTPEEAQGVISPFAGRIYLGGVNGPRSVLLSGEAEAIEALQPLMQQRGTHYRPLRSRLMGHCPPLARARAEMERALDSLGMEESQLPFFSSATGGRLVPRQAPRDFWARAFCDPFDFKSAVDEALQEGCVEFLEVSPHPILRMAVEDSLRQRSSPAFVLPSMQRGQEERATLLGSLGRLYVQGHSVDWSLIFPGATQASLPWPAEAPPETLDPVREEEGGLLRKLLSAEHEGRRQLVQELLASRVALALGRPPVQLAAEAVLGELGLDSLSAAELKSHLAFSLGADLPLAAILQGSLSRLTGRVLEQLEGRSAELEPAPPSLTPGDPHAHEPFPLNDIQHAYWIGRQGVLEWGNVATHVYLELDGALEPVRLERAWNLVVKKHDMLRAIFLHTGQQQVLVEVPYQELEVVDLRGQPPEAVERALAATRERLSHSAPPLGPGQWRHFELLIHLLDGGRTRLHLNLDMLICDALSLSVLFADWQRFYEEPELPATPPGVSFRQYLLWERQLEETEASRQARQYWQQRLPSLPPAPELPRPSLLDREKLRVPGIVHQPAWLEASRWQRLKAESTRRGLTPSSVLCAAFAETLAFWARRSQFTINLTQFRRAPVHPEVNALVGDFTSTLLLAVDWSTGGTFEERARRLAEQLWRDLDHSRMSGVQVLRELSRHQRQPVYMPVIFTSALGDLAPATCWAGQLEYFGGETSQSLLDSRVHEYDGQLILAWDVMEDHFPPGLAARMFEVYLGLIRRLADGEPEAWGPRMLSALHEEEWKRIATLNATETPREDELLQQMPLQHLATAPERPAVIAPDRVMSYGELYRHARALGRGLREAGVRPGSLVGVVTEPGWERVVSVLAVLEAGAAYLPIDPRLPPARIHYLLANGEVQQVLTQPRLEESLSWPENIVRLRVGASTEEEQAPLPSAQRPEDLAYVIYTSGSTGQPKGVMIDHRGAANTCRDINRRLGIGREDRVLALSSLSFDLSVYDIFGLLAAGGTIVYVEAKEAGNPAVWAEAIERHGVTVWNSVPALMDMLVAYCAARAPGALRTLRRVLLSGDWIPVDLPDKLRALAPAAEVLSLGGATEASIWSILYPIGRVESHWASIPYGKPMDNQRFYVLDERLAPCPPWVPGHLYIGGIGLARGYWRDESRTRASFIHHEGLGERLYRTGDLGRYLPDGNIEFLGREDAQVKLNGFRIELGEIEAVLRTCPGVEECFVLLLDLRGPQGSSPAEAAAGQRGERERFLMAYVLPAPGTTLEEHALRGILRQRLPEYMLPARFMFIDKAPLGANGKVDRLALPRPELAPRPPGASIVAASTKLEELVVGIWAELLGLPREQLSVRDNFFDLGGNSVILVKILALLAEKVPTPIHIMDFFRYPTIELLCRFLEGAGEEQKASVEGARRRAELIKARRRGQGG